MMRDYNIRDTTDTVLTFTRFSLSLTPSQLDEATLKHA